jgi:signal transduction histidine kinase
MRPGDPSAARRTRALRWDLVLPLAALAVAAALVVLGAATLSARSERRALALEGRLVRAAHRVEVALREATPEESEAILARQVEDSGGLLRGLALSAPDGRVLAEVGSRGPTPAGGADEPAGPGGLAEPGSLEVDLFLGPGWHGRAAEGGGRGPGSRTRGPGMGRGRRVLHLVPSAAALRPPWSERLLLPVVGIAATALVVLSLLGGRLLVRRQREIVLEAERHRLEGLARAGAGLAHQLRTPLATIKGTSQLLLEEDEEADHDRTDRIRRMVTQAERMERLLGDLLDYARPPGAEPRSVAVAGIAREVAALDRRVEVQVDPGLAVVADPEHLRQILANLVENALSAGAPRPHGPDDPAGPPPAPVEITARPGRPAGTAVEIAVADRGPGPGGDPERLFEPYVTSRPDGTGLGLPIARALARANGGEVTLAARPGGGTVATLRLPPAAGVPAGAAG